MFSKYKRGEIVIISGKGEEDGQNYINKIAIIIEKDPYFKDYLVKFLDGKKDWILPKYIQRI